MSDSEIMTILVLFHTSHFRNLKSFYLDYICQHMHKEFLNVISYNLMLRKRAVIETVNDELKNSLLHSYCRNNAESQNHRIMSTIS